MSSNSPLREVLGCLSEGLKSPIVHALPAALSGPSIKDAKNAAFSVNKKMGLAATDKLAYAGLLN